MSVCLKSAAMRRQYWKLSLASHGRKKNFFLKVSKLETHALSLTPTEVVLYKQLIAKDMP